MCVCICTCACVCSRVCVCPCVCPCVTRSRVGSRGTGGPTDPTTNRYVRRLAVPDDRVPVTGRTPGVRRDTVLDVRRFFGGSTERVSRDGDDTVTVTLSCRPPRRLSFTKGLGSYAWVCLCRRGSLRCTFPLCVFCYRPVLSPWDVPLAFTHAGGPCPILGPEFVLSLRRL